LDQVEHFLGDSLHLHTLRRPWLNPAVQRQHRLLSLLSRRSPRPHYFFDSFTSQSLKLASKFLVIAATISYLWEFIGVETGLPFGQYSYTNLLGPPIGLIPIFIPLLWCALGYFCLQASDYYVVASALMVSLDLPFDPVFSTSLHLWTWQSSTQYFGVPLSNFFGWFIASLTHVLRSILLHH
jgi:putative membrane protein